MNIEIFFRSTPFQQTEKWHFEFARRRTFLPSNQHNKLCKYLQNSMPTKPNKTKQTRIRRNKHRFDNTL